jgi:hypothetical protein
MNESLTQLMGSGYFYQIGEQVGESLAKKLEEAFKPMGEISDAFRKYFERLEEISKVIDRATTPSVLPEIGKCYQFWLSSDETQCLHGTVLVVDFPWVKIANIYGDKTSQLNLNAIGSYHEVRPSI